MYCSRCNTECDVPGAPDLRPSSGSRKENARRGWQRNVASLQACPHPIPFYHALFSSSRLFTLNPVLSASSIPSACSKPVDTTALIAHNEKHFRAQVVDGEACCRSCASPVAHDAAPPIRHTHRKTPRIFPQQLFVSVCSIEWSRVQSRVVLLVVVSSYALFVNTAKVVR